MAFLRRKPFNGIEYRHDVLEVAPGFRVNGIDGAEHLGGEQNIVNPDPLDQQLHGFFVVDRHVPVDLARCFFEWFEAFFDMHAAVSIPLVGNGSAAMRYDDL